MDFAHIHLMLNHVPVIGVGFGVLILVVGVIAQSKPVTRVGLGFLALSAIFAVPVYLTGEPAEEIVEKLPGFSEAITGEHESAATISLGLVIFTGLLAVVALIFTLFTRSFSARLPGVLVIATLLTSLVTGTSMIRTANLGGQIRHTEIRVGAQNASPNAETGTSEKDKTKKDDDD